MLDRVIAFSLLAYAVQAAILVADTKGWLASDRLDGAGCRVLGRWRGRFTRRLAVWRSRRERP